MPSDLLSSTQLYHISFYTAYIFIYILRSLSFRWLESTETVRIRTISTISNCRKFTTFSSYDQISFENAITQTLPPKSLQRKNILDTSQRLLLQQQYESSVVSGEDLRMKMLYISSVAWDESGTRILTCQCCLWRRYRYSRYMRNVRVLTVSAGK